jgi:hypothetical protein
MGEQKLLFSAWRKKITVGRQGGINTLRSGTTTTIFESPEPQGIGDFSRLTWEQPRTFKHLISSKLADRSFVGGMILVFKKTFKHLISSMPLLVSLLIVRLVLYSNSK